MARWTDERSPLGPVDVSGAWPDVPGVGGLPPTPPAPPSPSSPPSRRGPSTDARNALLIAGIVVAVLLLFATTFTWVVSRDTSEAAAPTTVPTVPSSPPSSAPPPTASTAPPTTAPLSPPTAAPVPELQQFVAEARGLPFLADVPVALLSDDEFAARLLASFSPGGLEQMLWEMQILGLLGTGPEAMDELEAMLTEGFVGYYAGGQVLVKGEQRSTGVDLTIVHELTHALDDQHFPFDRPELADVLDEKPFGLESLIEGSALNVERAYAAQLGIDLPSLAEDDPSSTIQMFPKYLFGESYVRSLLGAGGNPRLDEAYRNLPSTSKEVMEERYHLRGYTPTPVDPPPAPSRVVDEGLFGEIRFWQMFIQVMERSAATELAATWTGDWHVVWVDGLEQCTRVDAELETPDAASVFAEALRAWAVSQDHAVVEELTSGLVRLTVCAPRPPPPPGSVSPA